MAICSSDLKTDRSAPCGLQCRPSRMAQWARDWGGLDDEYHRALPLAEPRQYTKNITSAALFYGKLYYGISAKDMLDFL